MSSSTANWDILREAITHLTHAEKLRLIEEVTRSLDTGDTADDRERLARLVRRCNEIAALPVHNPDDGFSSRDHDRVLYGDAK